MNSMLPCNALNTPVAASAMASRKESWSPSNALGSASSWPEWMRSLPCEEAMPIEMFFRAPPKPPITWPLKWERTT